MSLQERLEHPTEAWLKEEARMFEQRQEEARLHSCFCCNWFFEDGPFKAGWGICVDQSSEDDYHFSQCTDTCEDWDAR